MKNKKVRLLAIDLGLFAYNKDTDYAKKIAEAEAEGNYQAAALYERQRNEKIAGENMNFRQTNKYSSYLNDKGSGGGNSLYDSNTDYASLINAAMDSGSTDADYLQGLLNARIAKAQDTNSYKPTSAGYNKTVQDYINDLRQPEIDLDSILQQIKDSIGPAPSFSSRWDDTADRLAQAAIDMDYEDWTGSDQYAALADRYGRQGQMSMQDVLGQISSRTGGLASSYATTAADQQYNDYMAKLEEIARQMYQSERSDALESAKLAMDYSDRDYSRYLNDLSQWGDDRSFAYQTLSDALANSQYSQEWKYKLQQDALANDRQAMTDAQDRVSSFIAAGGNASDLDPSLVNSSGYTTAELAALEKYYRQQAVGSGSGGGGSLSDSLDKWATADDYTLRYGADAGEDYVREHYKELGYSNVDAAIAGLNNHMREIGGMSGLLSGDAGADPKITNRHSESWVTITGLDGRYTWRELYNMVERGEVIEVYDADKNTVTYKKNLG